MKKLLIICATALFASNLFATDETVTESFSQVPAFSMVNDRTFLDGDLLQWAIRYGRRKADEKIGEEQATWLNAEKKDNATYGYLEMNENFEGGIKNVAFKWGHGNEEGYTVVLRMFVRGKGAWEAEPVQSWSHSATTGDAWNEQVSYDLGMKKNSRIKFDNRSVTSTGEQPTAAKGRVLIGDITITPYLKYTTKYVTIDDVATYTNTDLINNTAGEGSIVYSLENNDDNIASINSSTGEVTVLKSGVVTVKATWGEVVTTYQLKMYKYSTENFAGVENSYLKYYNETPTAIPASDGCTWTCMLAGINTKFGDFGDDNKAIGIKAPYNGSAETAYIQSSTREGGLSKLVFKWNLNGQETKTTWDIRFLVNGREVKRLTNAEITATDKMLEPGTITIDNINQIGNYTLRIENHSTVPDYTKDHKARFVMDDFEFYGYYSECGTCFPVNFP